MMMHDITHAALVIVPVAVTDVPLAATCLVSRKPSLPVGESESKSHPAPAAAVPEFCEQKPSARQLARGVVVEPELGDVELPCAMADAPTGLMRSAPRTQ